jgi:DNA-binding transcriptional LysR family regulator
LLREQEVESSNLSVPTISKEATYESKWLLCFPAKPRAYRGFWWLAGHAGRPRLRSLNLDLLRSFFAISEFGSLSKAAEQLHVSQSTLTRQVQALEAEIGGQLLDRGHRGAALTAAGHALLEGMRPVVAQADAVIAEARQLARGQSASLRIGYIVSAADYLNPALAALRKAQPKIKVRLVDLSPGRQIAALRRGELDAVVLGNLNAAIAREFFVRRIKTLPVVVALPADHPLAANDDIALADLRGEMFVGTEPGEVPGFNHWVTQLCRRAGFRPRFMEYADSLTHTLSLLVAENAVTVLPGLMGRLKVPGVAFRPLRTPKVTWDLQVAWQRGKIAEPVRQLVAALTKRAAG